MKNNVIWQIQFHILPQWYFLYIDFNKILDDYYLHLILHFWIFNLPPIATNRLLQTKHNMKLKFDHKKLYIVHEFDSAKMEIEPVMMSGENEL